MNVLACYGTPLMDAESRTYIMKIYFASLVEKKSRCATSNSTSNSTSNYLRDKRILFVN